MIVNINGTTYEFIKKFVAYNLSTHGIKEIQEQQDSIQKFIDKNLDIKIFQNGAEFIMCKEIEEANYREIIPELTNGEIERI